MKGEKILDGTFKEGLCYIKSYDGAFKGDYQDPADAMTPEAVLAAEHIPLWPTKYQAFLIHEDGTIDIVCYHSVSYSTYLREEAFEIWMAARNMKMMVPTEKWLEYPNGNLIAVNSPRAMYHQMIADMLRFGGIEISQFGELKPRENQILKGDNLIGTAMLDKDPKRLPENLVPVDAAEMAMASRRFGVTGLGMKFEYPDGTVRDKCGNIINEEKE